MLSPLRRLSLASAAQKMAPDASPSRGHQSFSPWAGEARGVRLKLGRDGVPIAPFFPRKGSSLNAPVKSYSPHGEDAGALFKRPIRRSFANLLPRNGVQNAIPRWIMPMVRADRWLLSGLFTLRPPLLLGRVRTGVEGNHPWRAARYLRRSARSRLRP